MCPPKVGMSRNAGASGSDGANQIVGSLRRFLRRGPGSIAAMHRGERLHKNDIDAPKPIRQLAHPGHVVPATGYAGDVLLDQFWGELFHA